MPESALLIQGVNLQIHRATAWRRVQRKELIPVPVTVDGKLAAPVASFGLFFHPDASDAQRRVSILRNAVRIGQHLFEDPVLYGDSAYYLRQAGGELTLAVGTTRFDAPLVVGDVLTIKAHRNQDVNLIYPWGPDSSLVRDEIGDLRVKHFGDRYLLLSAFRKRVENSRLISPVSPEVRVGVAQRLLLTSGANHADFDHSSVVDSLAEAARHIHFITDIAMATKELQQQEKPAATSSIGNEIRVLWHDRQVGMLSGSGANWIFEYTAGLPLKLSLSEKPSDEPGKIPSFLGGLLPENSGSDQETLEERMELFTQADRYTSNISVQQRNDPQARLIQDVLEGRLADYMDPTGGFEGKASDDLRKTLLNPEVLNSTRHDRSMPRISGMQVKLACRLDRNGEIDLSKGKAFTHIVKLIGGATEYSSMCSMEWYGLSIAKEVGLQVEDFAIANIGLSTPSLIVERFDIRTDQNDRRYIMAEEMWSVLGARRNKLKYEGDLLDVAKSIMKHSTDVSSDGAQLMGQAMVSWLISNSDMHLKNLLLLKQTSDPSKGFTSVRLSPTYDMMCTQVFPNDARSAAMSIGGNRHHNLHAFVTLGEVLGYPADQVVAMARYVATKVATAGVNLAKNLPNAILAHEKSVADIHLASSLIDRRCGSLLDECDAYMLNPRAILDQTEAPDDAGDAVDEHVQAEMRRSTAPIGVEEPGLDGEFDAGDVSPAPRGRRPSP